MRHLDPFARLATLAVTVPLPGNAVSPNSTAHWSVKGTAKGIQRRAATAAMLNVKWQSGSRTLGFERVRISAEFYLAKKFTGDGLFRPRDKDNAWAGLKATIDGLVDAGLLKADDHTRLDLGTIRLYRTAKEHKGRSEVVITIEVLA